MKAKNNKSDTLDSLGGEDIKVPRKSSCQLSKSILEPGGVELTGKTVIDVSGGEGFFAKYVKDNFNAEVYLTEYNKNAVKFAETKVGIPAFFYDVNDESKGLSCYHRIFIGEKIAGEPGCKQM